MELFSLILYGVVNVAMVMCYLQGRGRFYQFPFWAGVIALGWFYPQAIGGYFQFSTFPKYAYCNAMLFASLCTIALWFGFNQAVIKKPSSEGLLSLKFNGSRLYYAGATLCVAGFYFYWKLWNLPAEELTRGIWTGPAVKYIFFTVAGDGPDLAELNRLCKGLNVKFSGRISAEQVPDMVAGHDAYLFPSNYEGFGLSLVEAMAGGCVPVSSLLKRVTDQIVEDHVSGFLVKPADTDGYASALKLLFDDPVRRDEMSNAARCRASDLFSVEAVSSRLCSLMSGVQSEPEELKARMHSIDKWRYPSGLRPGLRTLLPDPLKNKLRLIRECLAGR